MSSSTSTSLTASEKSKVEKAQRVQLNWENACSEELLKTVTAHSEAIGAPIHYIFFPLLTVAASFMGVNATIKINDEWPEPAILWNVVAARKGEKKTAALKRLLKAVEVSC